MEAEKTTGVLPIQKDLRQYLRDVTVAVESIEKKVAGFTIDDLKILQNKWPVERGIQ